MTITFVLTSDKPDFTTDFTTEINLDVNKKYEAALISLDMYNSIPNIEIGKNDLFIYSSDNGTTWKSISIGTGSFEIEQLNNEIQRQMIINGDYDNNRNLFYINLLPNVSKLTSIVNITNPSYQVDFRPTNTIGPLLGFSSSILLHGYNESQNIVDIMSVNSILVNTDIINGSYVNKNQTSAIYSFFPNVPPGYKFIGRPYQLIYYPINIYCIESIRIWLTDQDGKLVNFRGERCTIRIMIKEVQNIENAIINAIKKLKYQNIL
jgi:hypothetical protein